MWNPDELNRIRETLVAQLEELQRAQSGLKSEVDQARAGDAQADPIENSILAEEQVALGVLDLESELKRDLQDAIGRLDRNVYGVCERCGKRIPKERLKAVPQARHCIACA